jgi:hypothetical protein
MIDKIIGRCKADRRAIEMLDEDQKEYLRRNAKEFLAARMKKRLFAFLVGKNGESMSF